MQHGQALAVMQLALAAARRGRGRTHPNPMVGAVVVRAGAVVGIGHHDQVGGPHAEIVALRRAGRRAHGSEMVVTLEPCCHLGRTGPCTEAIIAAGIRRVWVAMRDPFPRVNGRGLARLRAAGIAVEVGLAGACAARLNEVWLLAQAQGRPFVTVKLAQSLDGKVACHTGASRWITSPAARRIGHRLRAAADVVMVGSGTALADDPRLTCRLPRKVARGRPPLRLVVDSGLRTPPGARLLADCGPSTGPVMLACGAAAPQASQRRLEAAGARVLRCPGPGSRVSLPTLLAALFADGRYGILLEGGPTLAGSLFDLGLVDRVYAFIAPRVLGGLGAPSSVAGVGAGLPAGGWAIEAPELFAAGPDLGITGRVVVPSRSR